MKKMADMKKKYGANAAVLLVAAIIFAALLIYASPEKEEGIEASEYAEYEKGKVLNVLSDATEADELSDGASRGEQLLTVLVQSGQYKGEELLVNNYVGPLYGVAVEEGDSVTMIISTYEGGEHRAVIYEYNRIPALVAAIIAFLLATLLIGGKTGMRSMIGLIFTIVCLFFILIPLLIKGAPTIPTVFLVCAYIAAVSFTLIGGVSRKSVSAFLGTLAGTLLAALFGLAAQSLARIDGMRISEIEPLLQLRQTGTPIGLRGLLIAGVIISSLGAVMDVAMSISSALEEVHAANKSLSSRELFKSGMNIGRDMVGTMTNTLILAFLGSGFTLIIYLYSLGLSFYQLLPSAYVAIEVISGISSSTGMILAIPLTVVISSLLIKRGEGSPLKRGGDSPLKRK
ncbi:MAG: YibE/F family protein [Mogibacterium sp.]|nr:YibE/F family protein [Mogibacterium sp.]